jgi:non-ribosomal peptide synthetase-like protein
MPRKVGFCAVTLLGVFLLYLPLIEGGIYLLGSLIPSLDTVLDPSGGSVVVGKLLVAALALSGIVFLGAVFVGLPLEVGISRALNAFIKPDEVYPLYGFHDRLHRVIVRLGRIRLFTYLFGDSSYIVHYLRALGSHLAPVEQTGSNFGIDVIQANACLSSVGTGTMVADGLTIVNDEVSSTSFCVSRASIGRYNFLGNDVTYPAGGRTGENCLLATKVMVPLDGELHENVGLLGSPPFEIPRTVDRDTRFDHLRTGAALRRGLAAKNLYNLRTMGIFLLARWAGMFLVLLLDLAAFDLYDVAGHVVMALLFALSLVISALYFALVERCMLGFGSLRPTYCSIYQRDFWLHERLWKVPAMQYLHVFDGTPFKGVIWRLMGVRVGKRLFDDGAHVSDRTLTTIGDDCVLNLRSRIQCHSEEDATFKSDRSTLGNGCTIGIAAVTLYGVRMGDGSVLAPDSFLMKGEEIPAHARWGGNPAREM